MATNGLSDLTVDTIMRRWPSTIGVFIAYKMKCVGCPIGRFHSLAEAAAAHRDAPFELIEEALEMAIAEDRSRADPAPAHPR